MKIILKNTANNKSVTLETKTGYLTAGQAKRARRVLAPNGYGEGAFGTDGPQDYDIVEIRDIYNDFGGLVANATIVARIL